MRRVVSYALWGTEPLYWNSVPAIIRAHLALYRGWEMWVHHDGGLDNCPRGKILRDFEQAGLLKLVFAEPHVARCRSMLWRMMPVWNPEVDAVVCRDMDSLITMEDRWAVEEWLESGLAAHGINDNLAHTVPLMGGMCGFRPKPFLELTRLRTWEDMIRLGDFRPSEWDIHGADQNMLCSKVWPAVRRQAMIHRIGSILDYPDTRMRVGVVRKDLGVPSAVAEGSIGLCNHLGSAGFDIQRASDFFDSYSPDNNRQIREIEVANNVRSTTNWAVCSSDWNLDYVVYLPLTTKWWSKAGYRTMLILVGDRDKWMADPKRFVAMTRAEEAGAKFFFMPPMEGHRTSTVAQVSRLFAAGFEVAPHDYLLTADADMWPLSPAFFNQMDHRRDLHVLYANAYGKEPDIQRYPLCYLGAKAGVWRQIMRTTPGLAATELQDQLDAGLGRNADGGNQWNYDEYLFGVRVREWLATADNSKRLQLINRPGGGPPSDRIDRSGWTLPATLKGKTDAHVLRIGDNYANWPKLRELLALGYTPQELEWADKYFAEFRSK